MAEKEYIERGALLTDEMTHTLPCSCGRSAGRVVVFVDDIEALPAADVVEVRHGEWMAKDHVSISKRGRFIEYSTYKCSICGKWNGRHKQNFCPNCGAKMSGEGKEQK